MYDEPKLKKKAGFSFQLAIFYFLLFNISFFSSNYLKRGSFELYFEYEKLYFLFFMCWIIASFIGKKFQVNAYSTYVSGILIVVRSSLYLTYSIAFVVVMLGLIQYSRIQIFSTCLMVCVLDIIAWSIFYNVKNGNHAAQSIIKAGLQDSSVKRQVSYFLICLDFLLVAGSFFIINYIKRGHFVLLPQYDKLLLMIYGVWFFSSLTSKKFKTKEHRNFYFSLWQWLKAGGLMLVTISVIVFGFRLFYFSRFQAFGSLTLLICMEIIFLRLYFVWQNGKEHDRDIESVDDVKNILNQENLPLNVDIETIRQRLMAPALDKLQKRILPQDSELYEFIIKHIHIDDMVCMETAIEDTNYQFVLNSDRTPVRLFLNLHKINDIRRVNQFFLQVHQMLLPGGYFIAWAHTIKTHKKWIYSRFPRQIANMIYVFDFCFNRIMPKLPGLKKIYFAMTKGNSRIISRAEVLGRLCFCGFEIVAEKDINMRRCFIARKVKTPSLDQNPTYGPFVSLKRVGVNRKIIQMHKFRTMHPYSEYLQSYIYDKNGLQKGGKMHGDFRMTTWGRIMRKCWIDELPMLYNWIKGDLQLVGVRPLSLHYYSLYDDELQELRQYVKPGLLPPFYADLPSTFEQICDSEKKYIRAFLKHPAKTQCRYFWKIFFNIVFRGIRSN